MSEKKNIYSISVALYAAKISFRIPSFSLNDKVIIVLKVVSEDVLEYTYVTPVTGKGV